MFKERMEISNYPKDEAMHKLNNLFKVPQSIWNRLYRYDVNQENWSNLCILNNNLITYTLFLEIWNSILQISESCSSVALGIAWT